MTPCTKRGFRSEHAAREASHKLGDKIVTYRCSDCGLIHITQSRHEKPSKRDRWKPSHRQPRHWKP